MPDDPLVIEGAPMRGSAGAQTVMIIYSDFQCPYCARFAREVLPEVERRYVATGQVALAFRHLPLPIHALAMPAAVLAECAGQQGRFWEMHDRLFSAAQLSEASLQALPQSMGLDEKRLTECASDESVDALVRASATEASALGIRGTPTFFWGARLDGGRVRVSGAMSGARPLHEFVARIDSVLAGESEGGRWWRWFE